jgi:integrase
MRHPIYPEGGGYTGAISCGFDRKGNRLRIKRKGRTKAQVKDKLREVVDDLEAGVAAGLSYTVRDAVDDFTGKGLKGKSLATIANYRSMADRNIIPQIGSVRLKELTADQLDAWMDERAGELSARSLRLIHQIVERAIRHAQARDKVRRNVASLVTVPEGRSGRPSKAMTLVQAVQLLATLNSADSFRLSAYAVLSLLTGVRTEEARALLWSEVDLEAGTVAVYRSVRAKGDTKTRRSRRVLSCPGRSSRRSARIARGRRRNGCGLAMHGRSAGLSSAGRMVLRWIAGRCGGSLARSPRRPGWGSSGLPASCVIRSCRSSVRVTCRWTTSASSSGTLLLPSPRRCTGTRSGLR